MKIAILGYGSFGHALGVHLSLLGHEIMPDSVFGSDMVLVCTPSFAVVSVLEKHKDEFEDQNVIICSKGFSDDGRLLSEIIEEIIPNKKIFFLYGPTLASEIEQGILSGMVLAGGKEKDNIKADIESDNFRIELSDDIVGVQVGAAMKNVVTIFIGIVEGAGLGQNTRALIFTKGFQEVERLGIALGAYSNTFSGISFLGDLTLNSRNRMLGVEIGKGGKLEELLKESKYPEEGITTIKNVKIMSKKIGIHLPFVDALYSILFENLPIEDGVRKTIL